MIRLTAIATAVFVLLSQLSHQAQAQEMPVGATPDSGSAYNNKMYRVEIKGRPQSDIELRRQSTVAKQIYGREELERYGDGSMVDVVRRLPGVDVQGGAPRLRGLGSGYTLILINGDPAPNSFTLEQLNPAQVERIEVSKAPSADQSAQAVGGSINFILKTAPRTRQQSMKIGAAYSTDHPTGNASYYFGERVGALSYSLPLSGYEWRGATELSVRRQVLDPAGVPDYARQLGNQAMWGHSLNASPQLSWRVDADESMSLQAFLQRGTWGSRVDFVNTAFTSAALLEDPSLNHGSFTNERLGAQWNRRLNGNQRMELKLTGGRAVSTFDNQVYQAAVPYRVSKGDGQDRSVIQSGKFTQLAGEKHTVSAGWEVETRRRSDELSVLVLGQLQLPGIEGVPFKVGFDRQAYFVQDEWDLSEQWQLYGGVRNERIRTRSDTLEAPVSNTSSVLTPLLHVNFKPDPKGKNLVRASLTRSYKAADLYALVSRPTLNSRFPLPNQANDEIGADRIGNPRLRPELATGVDIAYEAYFGSGAMFSAGVFHRRVSDLIRYVNKLETVSYATLPRWVTRPENFSNASTSGLELEVKGKARDILPALFEPPLDLGVRAALNVYRSSVDAVPLPNNRLDGQQPWSATMGFDYLYKKVPLTVGANFAYTPSYVSQQTLTQAMDQSRTRALDLYGQWKFSPQITLRFAATNMAPLTARRTTFTDNGTVSDVGRKALANYSLTLELKL